MSVIVYLIMGGLVGWLAAKVAGRREGVIASVLIGIVGSFLGGFLSRLVTGSDLAVLAFSWTGLFWSFVGALLLVVILNAIWHKPHHHYSA